MFIDDVVHAFVQAMDRGSGKLVNIGTGLEASVNHLYQLLADIIGFDRGARARAAAARASSAGSRSTSRARPSAIAWKPWTHLEDGLAETVAFLKGI